MSVMTGIHSFEITAVNMAPKVILPGRALKFNLAIKMVDFVW